MLATSDDSYNVYDCSEHGILLKSKDKDNGKCFYSTCKGMLTLVENVEYLKDKYKKELGLYSYLFS